MGTRRVKTNSRECAPRFPEEYERAPRSLEMLGTCPPTWETCPFSLNTKRTPLLQGQGGVRSKCVI